MTRLRLILAVVTGVLATSVVAHAQTSETVTYYHTDGLGSVRLTTNEAGQVVARYDYLPFGEAWMPPPVPEPRRFGGKERDTETGLDYLGARYYASGNGRFTTVDPLLDIESSLEDPQRWNRYTYALNNPLKYKDEDGRIPIPVIIAGVTAFAASPAGQPAIVAGSAFLQRYGAQLQRAGAGDLQRSLCARAPRSRKSD
jgi:RHS repeat-associated protein